MIHGTFPLAKFTFLTIKQIINPIHKAIVTGARNNNVLRNYMCLPLAKWYTICDIRIRYRHQNWRKVQKEAITDEKNAIENGAYILAEITMGITIIIIFFVEYKSNYTKDVNYEIVKRKEENTIMERLKGLEETVHRQSIQLDQLSQLLMQLHASISKRNSI